MDDITSITHAFTTDEKIYSDEHFFHFQDSVTTIVNHIDGHLEWNPNFHIPASGGEAKRWLYSQMRSCWGKHTLGNKNV